MRGPSEYPNGPLIPEDVLDAGRVDAPRRLRPPLRAASHDHGMLTPSLAAAMAARDTTALRARSRHDRSTPPPWRACRAATAWPSPCRGWAQAAARAGVSSYVGDKNYSRHDTG